MLINDFIRAINEGRGMEVGKPTNDGKEMSARRDVSVATMPKRLNAAKTPTSVAKPAMGGRKDQKPTAKVGQPTNDGIAFSGRRAVPVAKVPAA